MNDICYPKTNKLLSASEALSEIRTAIEPVIEQECVTLPNALGRILAKTICSPIDIPPQRNAAMDGYAFASSDIVENQAFTLENIGTSWAGHPFEGTVARQQCVRIFTGAVVPDFADSVIPQEQVKCNGNKIRFPDNTKPFKNIRAAGSDVEKQDILIGTPKVLGVNDIALLAAAGVTEVPVYRPLKIGFFSAGDELTSLGQPLKEGQIYDSNRYMLDALLKAPNHSVTDLGIIEDKPDLLEKTFKDAADTFDVLISTGGASVGEADFIKQTLEKCGQVNFWKLAIKPGKPLAFGRVQNCWFFGLPGNPVAVLVTFTQFVKPALLQLAGAPALTPLRFPARCQSPLRKSSGRQEFQRGILNRTPAGEFIVKAAGRQDSHQLKVASLANCFIILDADCTDVEPGQMVMVEPFDNQL
ncbi:MAG: molybdopterin molybdotransferase MoeA [Gammaproteobacteria bacterium]